MKLGLIQQNMNVHGVWSAEPGVTRATGTTSGRLGFPPNWLSAIFYRLYLPSFPFLPPLSAWGCRCGQAGRDAGVLRRQKDFSHARNTMPASQSLHPPSSILHPPVPRLNSLLPLCLALTLASSSPARAADTLNWNTNRNVVT